MRIKRVHLQIRRGRALQLSNEMIIFCCSSYPTICTWPSHLSKRLSLGIPTDELGAKHFDLAVLETRTNQNVLHGLCANSRLSSMLTCHERAIRVKRSHSR
jgi:hypothetical protein